MGIHPIRGDRLYVNLGASATRRRLKGRGLGVRKVESADSGRAVIIHTATGQHLRELEAIFQDVRDVVVPVDKSSAKEDKEVADE